MSTAHPAAKVWDTTTTALVPIRVTMAKEDVLLDTGRTRIGTSAVVVVSHTF